MKALNEKRKEKSIIIQDKLKEKKERLRDLEIKNDNERKLIIKKLETMQLKKNELDREKEENLLKIKLLRDSRFEKTRYNRSMLELKEKEKRDNILNNEEEKMDRVLSKEKRCNSVKRITCYQTIGYQKKKAEKMKNFLKELNNLKSESMMKKNDKQKKQIYINKLKRDAEERKKELEKKMEKIMGIS